MVSMILSVYIFGMIPFISFACGFIESPPVTSKRMEVIGMFLGIVILWPLILVGGFLFKCYKMGQRAAKVQVRS